MSAVLPLENNSKIKVYYIYICAPCNYMPSTDEFHFTFSFLCVSEQHRRDVCNNYVRLNQPDRSINNIVTEVTYTTRCDRALQSMWYRFESPAGGKMPETCVQEFGCGTHVPVWLNGIYHFNPLKFLHSAILQ